MTKKIIHGIMQAPDKRMLLFRNISEVHTMPWTASFSFPYFGKNDNITSHSDAINLYINREYNIDSNASAACYHFLGKSDIILKDYTIYVYVIDFRQPLEISMSKKIEIAVVPYHILFKTATIRPNLLNIFTEKSIKRFALELGQKMGNDRLLIGGLM